MRRLFFLVYLFFALNSALAVAASAESIAELNDFLETHTGSIYDILTRIHEHAMTEHERFLVLTADNDGYVQCMFHDDDTRIYCEASSGFYQTPKPKISKKQCKAIVAQGFSIDGKQENFNLEVPMGGQATLWNIAGLMLETLYRGYGDSHFTMNAPLVMPEPPESVLCESNEACDRDPEHLEAFVAGFYKWYVESRENIFKLRSEYPLKTRTQYSNVLFTAQHEAIKQQLTPHFYAWYRRKMNSYDGQYPSHDCADPDSDPVLCQFQTVDTWQSSVNAQMTAIENKAASFVVNLPDWTFGSDGHGAAYQLSVRLKIADGMWKIDSVKSLEHEPHSDNFHAPRTEAEKAIAEILKLDVSTLHSAPVYYYLTGYKTSANDAYYDTLFSKALRNSIIKANRAALNENCGGKYIDGEMCGLDENPVNCSNDFNDVYFFRTEEQTADEAVISYQWPGDHDAAAIYKLQKVGNRWKLDGVDCGEGGKFNVE